MGLTPGDAPGATVMGMGTNRAPADVAEALQAPGDGQALARLARRRREEARADLARVHPTWLLRALQEESPAVRAIVAAHGPARVGTALRADGGGPGPDRPPHPEVLAWVLSLWTERLVGGAVRDDHPPVVAAVTRLSRSQSLRLWITVGRVKSALASEDVPPAWIQERLGAPSAELRAWARRDVDAALSAEPAGPRNLARKLASLGLVTAMRLLDDCEPFTTRWALQSIPYPVVRQARGALGQPRKRSATVSRLEGLILRTAWERLRSQGRIAIDHPGRPSRSDDGL